jgi:hypothetical protein
MTCRNCVQFRHSQLDHLTSIRSACFHTLAHSTANAECSSSIFSTDSALFRSKSPGVWPDESVWRRPIFVWAWLQPCGKCLRTNAASAAEGRYLRSPRRLYTPCQPQTQRTSHRSTLERKNAPPNFHRRRYSPMHQPTPIHAIALRCPHRLPASGQCRSLATDRSGLCGHHLAKKCTRENDSDFAKILLGKTVGFQTAQGTNHSLGELYELLARDRISVRRAATLAYISSLLLRTLPALDKDVSSGIEAGLKRLTSFEPPPSDS